MWIKSDKPTDLRITSNKLFIDVLRSFILFWLERSLSFFRNYFKVNEMSSHCHFSHIFKNTCMYVCCTSYQFFFCWLTNKERVILLLSQFLHLRRQFMLLIIISKCVNLWQQAITTSISSCFQITILIWIFLDHR